MDDRRSRSTSRRRLLAALGSVLAGGLAGCPGRQPPGSDGRSGVTPAPVPTGESRGQAANPVDDVRCPGMPERRGEGRRLCGTESDPDSEFTLTRAAAADDRSVPALPRAILRFRFQSAGDRRLGGLAPPWSLQKYAEGEWHTVRPRTVGTDGAEPVGRRTWELAVDNDATARLDPRNDAVEVGRRGDRTRIPLAGLGGGSYAFVVAGWPETSGARPVAVGSRFRLDGPPLTLTVTETVGDVRRDGDSVTVEADPGFGDPVTYAVERVADWDVAPQLVAEQVVRHPPLRNLLAATPPDVDRTVLRTREHPAYPPLTSGRFSFRASGYQVIRDPE